MSGADMIGHTQSDTYTVANYDLVSYFARRFPEDTFPVADVLATAMLFLWAERLCLISLLPLGFAVGTKIEISHQAAVVIDTEVQFTVECVEWYGRMTDWTFQATVGDKVIAKGKLTMASVDYEAFMRRTGLKVS